MDHSTARAVGVHRVLEPEGVLPQAAWRLDASPAIGPDEVRVRVRRLNLDAASYQQLRDKHFGDGARVRAGTEGRTVGTDGFYGGFKGDVSRSDFPPDPDALRGVSL